MAKQSKKQEFISRIECNILSGKWKVGDQIPTERELVSMYGTSRTVVNAALSELAQKGFLKINPRQWTQVADYKKEGTLAVIFSMMQYNGRNVDMELLQSVLDARLLVETESAKLAALKATDEDIALLGDINQKEKSVGDIKERAEIDYSFHHALTLAGGNLVYPLIINSFRPFALVYLEIFYSRIEQPSTLAQRHGEIIMAIKDRDAECAERLVRELLLHGERVLKIRR